MAEKSYTRDCRGRTAPDASMADKRLKKLFSTCRPQGDPSEMEA